MVYLLALDNLFCKDSEVKYLTSKVSELVCVYTVPLAAFTRVDNKVRHCFEYTTKDTTCYQRDSRTMSDSMRKHPVLPIDTKTCFVYREVLAEGLALCL